MTIGPGAASTLTFANVTDLAVTSGAGIKALVQALKIVTALQEKYIAVAEFGQGYVSMSAPTEEIERLVVSKKLVHPQNPVPELVHEQRGRADGPGRQHQAEPGAQRRLTYRPTAAAGRPQPP